MRVGILFRVGNERLKTYGRFTMMRTDLNEPMLCYPNIAAIMKASLLKCGVKTVRFVPEAQAQRMNSRHFHRLWLKWGRR